ncbi:MULTISPECIES: TolC family outer membrane protein [Thalassolituus]|jgi:outer membrane protein|uniref:TolC family outer membrane protein n=1 Tax=Thalassolituus TaxID=187492 RepID=UPI000C0AD3D9|nr:MULTISPECIES: TolC family outer membrane protein [Thalassolituus]MAK92778.1 secretion protein [Thalassolituus sp.]MCB2386010.1 TolC family outer membrane protein [Thalassolituus alkanivorans]MCB2422637.1 TolC family outer membrane protein [Thalassolituus alkanivorans]|tara:strand:+ start:705 stop:2036 length:1332 start_codon:yes stop_codon:yes gene_type:complete
MKKLLSLTIALLASGAANAADLSTIYQQAASNDAEIAAARAIREANSYNVTIARGALLPQAQISYSQTSISSEADSIDLVSGGYVKTDKDYDLSSLEVSASQTLFNLNSWYTYQAAVSGDDAAGLQLQLAEQQLLLRTAQAYFNVLRAQDNLSTAQAEEKAVKRSLEQTKQRFEVGLIAITDVHEAQAGYDLSYVNLLGQEAALDISYEALEQLTGQRFEDVSPLKADVAMEMPQPANAADWVQSGLDKYAGVLIAEASKDGVRLQRNAARSNHLPSVSLFGSYTDADQAPFVGDDPTDSTVTAIGVKISMPLLAGGSLYGQSKQSALNYAAADYQLEKQRRDVKQNIRSLFRQVQTDTLNIKARKQAITSAQSALEATQTGYKVGTRNIVEVLNAQKNLFSAQRDYANARYDYIINLLSLKFYAGTLNEGDIQTLNSWLASA